MTPSDDLKPLSPETVSEPVPDPARPSLPPITRVNSRILYAAAIFGLIVIWVVTFTVTSRHPQTKPPAPPQVQDAAPNLDSLATLAERLRVAQEMQKKLAAEQERPAPFDPFRGSSETEDEQSASPERGRQHEALGSAAFPESPSLPPLRYAAEAAPRPPQPAPGKTRLEQALAAPPLVAPAGSSTRSEAAEPETADPTSRLVQWMERRMPADSAAPSAPAGPGTAGDTLLRPESPVAAAPQVVRPASALTPYVLYEGTILPAVLTSELTSDLPGLVTATLRGPVFDSPSGHHLILPAGTRALGRYDTNLASGDSRLLVSWHRLILPDGRFFEIPLSNAVDVHGSTGLTDRSDRHLARAFTSTLLLSLLSAGAQLAQPNTYSNSYSNTYRPPTADEIAAGAVGQQVTHLSTNLLERDLDVKPTLTIRPGTVFGIVLQADLAFAAAYSPSEGSRTETLP
jgi:type IV secretion system protein VirB10